jgi:Leucine-rich repeat (LRR) protein
MFSDLSRNSIQTILPLSFNSLASLDRLNLAQNHLSTIQPGAFYGAHNLRHLNLSSNRLNSDLISDGGLYGLGEMEELDLSNNQLTSLPSQIHNYVPNLRRLFLNGNSIKQLIGSKINLPKLEYLSLASNQLDSIQAGTFSALTSLIEL